MTTANAYVQTTTAPDMRGRVMALYLGDLHGRHADRGSAARMGGRRLRAALVDGGRGGIRIRRRRHRRGLLGAHARGAARLGPRRPLAARGAVRRDSEADRELATTEIAVVETQTQR